MPLHQIPLCGFNYVGDFNLATFDYKAEKVRLGNFKYAIDVIGGATFKYDTTERIKKNENKLFYRDKVIKINKVNSRYMYDELKTIYKNNTKSMYDDVKVVDKNNNKLLKKNISEIVVLDSKDLEVKDKEIRIQNTKNLDIKTREIQKEKDKIIFNEDIIEFNKNSSLELGMINIRQANISRNKQLVDTDNLKINKESSLELENSTVKGFNKKDNILSLENKIKELHKDVVFSLKDLNTSYLTKDHSNKFITKETIKNVDSNNNKYYFYTNQEKKISQYIYRYVNVFNNKRIDKNNRTSLLYRNKFTHLYKFNSKGLDRINSTNIALNIMNKLMYRDNIKNIYKKYTGYYVHRIDLKTIHRFNEKYFYREGLKAIDKYYNRYLDREAITSIQKDNEKYLDYIPLINIYKQIEKDLLDLTIWDIYKEHDRQLQDTLIKDIYKVGSNNKFIEVTKRWWWLRPTAPTDRIIVPNKDYARMKELLENANYEYLRYNEHPIEWGKQWGIDYNIPPYAVSIEIMLDLINILIMIWHKNTQGWLCCSGKEAMQFIMELLYDWYTMETSTPNTDYIRAYRWIRWEAEKVYFLNTENGLQAIGILIANLIDYMKYHHFDLVPLWRNPKAMDIERNFNKIATNGDIMKDLDKLKGNRHYYIETQNFERKNIFGE